MDWEAVIGIETHVELSTQSKMFCGCAVSFGEAPNTNVCPTCLGLPGALPVTNLAAIEAISRIGLALNCTIAPTSVFHRKNYFYADLPKNYQITQYDLPVCRDGWLEVETDDGALEVGIERAHMEEDTGKSLHVGTGGRIHSASATLLDFNRSGVPLVEIVSRPDLRTPAQARAYALELRSLVAELGVSDARMEEGSIRFDANVSVRRPATEGLGTKVEIKNMNSFRSLERALAHEIARQITILEDGGEVVQETRHWDEEEGITHGMRTKEGSSDYRYFTEPDLVPLEFGPEWRDRLGADLPEAPSARRRRYLSLGLDDHQAEVLVASDKSLRELFEEAVGKGAEPAAAANWVTGEITAALRKGRWTLSETGLTAAHLSRLVAMVQQGRLSASAAKEVLTAVMAGEGSPDEVAASRDLLQVSDEGAIAGLIDTVLGAHPEALARLRRGDQKVLGFLVGQVMKASAGKADPKLVNELLRRRTS
jgi:aspartyl-tRNA(Asn)/glutamyl-tRNA(Gln) amidotransferase subunit B